MEFTNIGRYEIKSEVGRGGMATVYRAYDPSFEREVAIKVLPREFLHNPQFLDRFKREIKTIAQLEHPAIVPVYDVGEHDGVPYFVMRYMPGGSLSDMIKKGRFSLEDTARIVERLASALSYAHRKGIVHRDLKPDNILFSEEGYPFISDFGIAKFAQAANTNLTGSGIIGTPAYMSPEQATGDTLDHRSDVYGLGVIVYHMLSGQQPYNADTPMGVAIKHVTDPVPDIRLIVSDLPEELGDVMKKVLAKDREQRYPTAVEFARALNQVVFGNPGNIQESAPTVRLIEKPTQTTINPKLYIGGAIGLVVLLLLIFGAVRLFSSVNTSNTETIAPPTATAIIAATPQDALVGEPTTAIEATDTPNATTNCDGQQFSTEEFDSSLCNWDSHAVIGSDFDQNPDVTVEPKNGKLLWDFQSKSASYYLFQKVTSPYTDVKVDVRVDNRGVNDNEIGLICQYDPKGNHWYEFRIIKGGFYKIWYAEVKSGNKLVFSRIADGASNFIKPGKDVNEYSITCSGNNLSLTINGQEQKTITERKYVLREGGVGVSVSSLATVGVNVEMEWFKVSQP